MYKRLNQACGVNRLIWNYTLGKQKEIFKAIPFETEDVKYRDLLERAGIGGVKDTYKYVKQLRNEHDYVKGEVADSLLKKQWDLDLAFKAFFNNKQNPHWIVKKSARKKKIQFITKWDYLYNLEKFPQFKSKNDKQSFTYEFGKGAKLLPDYQVELSKIGVIKYFKDRREIVGKPTTCTVSKKNNNWYISIHTKCEVNDPIHGSNKSVGIDLGVKKFAALYDNEGNEEIINGEGFYRKLEKKLAREKRILSRRVEHSKNWYKQNLKVNRISEKIARCRRDFLQKNSTKIVEKYGKIVLEDLSIKNMSKSSKGDNEKPGKNVKQKSGLNKSILDQGWYEFRRELEYKSKWRGGIVEVVDPKYTSQSCSQCGHVWSGNRKSQSVFSCENCGFEHNADLNAAKNILMKSSFYVNTGGHSGINEKITPV